MPSLPRHFRLTPLCCLRVAALVSITTLLALWQYGRLNPDLWDVPAAYAGDAMEILARLQAASEGDLRPAARPVIERLGAPFGADWSEYPPSDTLLFSLLGLMAGIVGVGVASNFALVLAHVLAAGSFYFCARWLRHRWEWALMGALLFSFTFHTVFRGLAHLSLVFTWTVPLALLCCGLIARGRRMERGSASWWLCVFTTSALAVSNPYNLFLFLQLLGWALVGRWLGDRATQPLRAGVLCLGLAAGLLAVTVLPQWVHHRSEGAQPVLVRNYGGTEKYALKPVELWIPPDVHHSELLASLGSRYIRWSDWRGETFSPYLGWVGGAGLALLIAITAIRLVRRRGVIPRPALPAAWVLAFSAVGGVNNLLAFFLGLQVFRATNRYSIFLSSIALMFVVALLSRWSRQWPRPAGICGAVLITIIGLWDQLPRREPDHEARIVDQFRNDQEFGRMLESTLPAGAGVYQLPFIEFPEAAPILLFNAYDHFRPYLATDTLKFSFGALKGRSISAWQREFAELPPERLVRALEEAGFAAIVLNRTAYKPEVAESLMRELETSAGHRRVSDGRGEQMMVALQPAVTPKPPIARTLTFGRGWNPPDPAAPGVHWTYGDASLSYFNPFTESIPVKLDFRLSAVAPRTVTILHNERLFVERSASPETGERLELELKLAPGVNHFEFRSDAPAVRTSEERNRLRDMAVHELKLEWPEVERP